MRLVMEPVGCRREALCMRWICRIDTCDQRNNIGEVVCGAKGRSDGAVEGGWTS